MAQSGDAGKGTMFVDEVDLKKNPLGMALEAGATINSTKIDITACCCCGGGGSATIQKEEDIKL